MKALQDPEDPENSKFLKESADFTTIYFGDQSAAKKSQEKSKSPGKVEKAGKPSTVGVSQRPDNGAAPKSGF